MGGGPAVSLAEWRDVWVHALHLTIAYALALPVGWDRSRAERSAGLRTFPLVAIGACSFVLIMQHAMREPDAQAQAQVLAGIVTGIGFIGGGTILKQADRTRGTATAASLWATAAVGAGVGFRLYDVAVVISVATFLTLRFMQRQEEARHRGGEPRPEKGDDDGEADGT